MQTSEYVDRVIDGDTFSTSGQGANVRLERVNAPEREQAGYLEAKAELTRLISSRRVTIESRAYDDYGRRVAQVWRPSDGLDVNSAMRSHLAQSTSRSFGFRGY